MKWQKQEDGRYKTEEGYLITPGISNGRRYFTAWGPRIAGWDRNLKVKYERGEEIPQPRKLIGTWSILDQAKMNAKKHMEKRKGVVQ